MTYSGEITATLFVGNLFGTLGTTIIEPPSTPTKQTGIKVINTTYIPKRFVVGLTNITIKSEVSG